jgi:hypothetical protein
MHGTNIKKTVLKIVNFIHVIVLTHCEFLQLTSRGTRHCPGWPMAKPDSNFVYYITKMGDGINFGNVSEWNMRHVTKGSTTYTKAHTCKKKKAASWMNTMSVSTINRKAKTCNEIGMLPSVWNVTEVYCFHFMSRNVNVCRVFDCRACKIHLSMWEAWITVSSCRSRNISQKGRNRLRRSKKVYKHRACWHRHTRDSQGWQHCVVIPLAKHLAGTTCVVRRQGTEEGRTKVR